MDPSQILIKKLDRQIKIRSILSNSFAADADAKLRKGVVQKIVAERMGSKHSKILCREVIDILKDMGVESVAVDGLYYFKGITFIS